MSLNWLLGVVVLTLTWHARGDFDRGVWEAPTCRALSEHPENGTASTVERAWTLGMVSGLNTFISEKVRFDESETAPAALSRRAHFAKIQKWCNGRSPFVSMYPAAIEAVRWHQDARPIPERTAELSATHSLLGKVLEPKLAIWLPEADSRLRYEDPGCLSLKGEVRAETRAWIFGLVTGLNTSSLFTGDLFSKKFPRPQDILAEFKNRCSSSADQSVFDVGYGIFKELAVKEFEAPDAQTAYRTLVQSRSKNIDGRLTQLAEVPTIPETNTNGWSLTRLMEKLNTPSEPYIERLSTEIAKRTTSTLESLRSNPFDGEAISRAAEFRTRFSIDEVLKLRVPYYAVDQMWDLSSQLASWTPEESDEQMLKYAILLHPSTREVFYLFLEWVEQADKLLQVVNALPQTSELPEVTQCAREAIRKLFSIEAKTVSTARVERGFQINLDLPIKLKDDTVILRLSASAAGKSLDIPEESALRFGRFTYSEDHPKIPGFKSPMPHELKQHLLANVRIKSVNCWQPYSVCSLGLPAPYENQPDQMALPEVDFEKVQTLKELQLERFAHETLIRFPYRFLSYRNLNITPAFSIK